ncbi:Exodeoxyribonuclease III [Ochrobactrum soli]|uniref:Exodeoxyribonuclease III n=1 Tax=Ochrobactrum soli TaxID=2448455 RepID=A0A2P9HB69_9HYPH|nr:Exodeoxyribonuclease III [[Ochrobactrum] soli]
MLAGDFNVMPTDLDVYAPERWRDDALFPAPKLEKHMHNWLHKVGRTRSGLFIQKSVFTRSGNIGANSFERDAGLRIDHLLLSPALAPALKSASVRRKPAQLASHERIMRL